MLIWNEKEQRTCVCICEGSMSGYVSETHTKKNTKVKVQNHVNGIKLRL